ncbi:hypothetical protein [Mangrovicella endophytica]|uniref:hypothetical protein n=1 Tax=Mangrovicella endophytica TaxID=2066697 RepID=UPI000C9E9ABB|nr:hypothetical protein [Mangrovicella endophytica]
MTVETRLGLVDATAAPAHAGGVHVLSQAAARIADYREGRSRLKAKDLVGLLLSHGARAWRSSQPTAHTRLRVTSPSGTIAVRIRFR